MSSTNTKVPKHLNVVAAALLVGLTSVSSLSFVPEAQAQGKIEQIEDSKAQSALPSVLVGGALVAYGWLADKSYDLGKEIGKWLAGSVDPAGGAGGVFACDKIPDGAQGVPPGCSGKSDLNVDYLLN